MCDKTISMYETGKIEYPKSMSSGIMGPCISVAIFDTKSKSGYMRHQPNADTDDDMENFIKETLKECSIENVKVCISGGAFDKDDDEMVTPDSVMNSRDYVEELVLKYFDKKQVSVKWIDNDNASELVLYTSKPEFKIKTY